MKQQIWILSIIEVSTNVNQRWLGYVEQCGWISIYGNLMSAPSSAYSGLNYSCELSGKVAVILIVYLHVHSFNYLEHWWWAGDNNDNSCQKMASPQLQQAIASILNNRVTVCLVVATTWSMKAGLWSLYLQTWSLKLVAWSLDFGVWTPKLGGFSVMTTHGQLLMKYNNLLTIMNK